MTNAERAHELAHKLADAYGDVQDNKAPGAFIGLTTHDIQIVIAALAYYHLSAHMDQETPHDPNPAKN